MINCLGLDNLTDVGGELIIEMNTSMTSFSGLGNLSAVGEDLKINDNPLITDFIGLESLTSVGGVLNIQSNSSLGNLKGLDNLSGDSLSGLILAGNNNLSICDISSICNFLFKPSGQVFIANNAIGCNGQNEIIAGCETCLQEGITFMTQSQIDSFQIQFPFCNKVGGGILINGPGITNLNGLNVLTSINGSLCITANDFLDSLTGIHNIDAGSIVSLTITYNAGLSDCEVKSICDYLANPGSIIEIHDNATGCNNQEEVHLDCTFSLDESSVLKPYLTICPNPTASTITISTPNMPNQDKYLNIYNINGQKLIERRITEEITTVDVAGLPHGVFIVRVNDENGFIIRRFVKH
jgi:hypothetical protein